MEDPATPVWKDLRNDYERHGGTMANPALWTLEVYRFGVWGNRRKSRAGRWVAGKLYGSLRLGIEVATGSTLNREAKIGEALHIVHSGNIKIHPEAVIGDRVGIMHDVTLGTNNGREGAPTIGNDVFIGAGAKILGAITIGDGAVIAANSLVINDVPAGATAIGVPARVIRYTGRQQPREGNVSNDCRQDVSHDDGGDREERAAVHPGQLPPR